MSDKEQSENCRSSSSEGSGCCHVEGVVQLDGRGQIVLPKNLREKMNLKEGDKLVVISMNEKGKIASISLMKSSRFDGMVKLSLRPIMKEIMQD
ncbi:MAG: AbrB/MazE/SpoVT family DNA-binding domain-containing protein [Candidatus Heimdallarchaeota archaeon]|nr:AbrB/MazE/SpoVT family DNA-binding domain-containing protein [Candidatus Heimdallarchaeota archaeon]MCG3255552.1 AbrB/MazE/SpoVT family DNA-binding domain-containing protein [Candidatus Heimdallarchaeota archaeon]MCK4610627.1 AbrB/MazE/SpoVT family DNA-binding domain-containing protein [Candidatus Heimdallarchaeota archaeon]